LGTSDGKMLLVSLLHHASVSVRYRSTQKYIRVSYRMLETLGNLSLKTSWIHMQYTM